MPRYITDETLDDWFTHHPPSTPGIVAAHQRVRAEFLTLARLLNGLLPEGNDKTYTLRQLRDTAMQANATIACAQKLYGDPV